MTYIFIAWIALSIPIAVVADRKGFSGAAYFFLGVLTSPLIAGIVAFGSPQNDRSINQKRIKLGHFRQCPHCAEPISPEASICRYCHSQVEPIMEPGAPNPNAIPCIVDRPKYVEPPPQPKSTGCIVTR